MASNAIETFWKSNSQYWITPPNKHAHVDKLIYDAYYHYHYNYQDETLVGKIIYLDQFSRHFARYGALDEDTVTFRRNIALELLYEFLYEDTANLETLDEFQILWCLMLLKHLKHYNSIFRLLHDSWLRGRPIKDFPLLEPFYYDTYKKAYSYETVKANIILPHAHPSNPTYDHHTICDYYPPLYIDPESWVYHISKVPLPSNFQSLYNSTSPNSFVSLSGGVDSMTMLTLLKLYGTPINAIHIVYGNRAESEDEYAFLTSFCRRLDVPLYVYKIPYLRRTHNDRTFYESMTRDLRFMVYKACAAIAKEPPNILLGHIQDDIVENIWTNISKHQHLDNLPKMASCEIQHDVTLRRPLLHYTKPLIYETSTQYAIPYFKNTTPLWCNRGKFRNHFHDATIQQYGPHIDKQIITFAQSIQHTYNIINDLLYKPIYNSYCPVNHTIDISPALQTTLENSHWIQIISHVCHNFLQTHRPSIKAICHLRSRIYHPCKEPTINVLMSSQLTIVVKNSTMKFVLRTT